MTATAHPSGSSNWYQWQPFSRSWLLWLLLACAVPLYITDLRATWEKGQWTSTSRPEHPNHDPLYESMAGLVSPYNYPLEQHFTTTSDGYILRLFRIPHGSNDGHQQTNSPTAAEPAAAQPAAAAAAPAPAPGPAGTPRPVVLLLHGIMMSSADFVLNGPKYSLATILADAGYDVWLANHRGNRFSRNHTHISPSDDKFWEFSYDEFAAYDLPAIVSYALATTQTQKLQLIGYSEGVTVAAAALANDPEVSSKISKALLLGPTVFASNMLNPMLRIASFLPVDKVLMGLGVTEVPALSPGIVTFGKVVCRLITPTVCRALLAPLVGYNPVNVDADRLLGYLDFALSGTSIQNLVHWAQGVRSKEPGMFRRHDYGTRCTTPSGTPRPCNQRAYGGQVQPPSYNLSLITTPLAVALGGRDKVGSPKDSALLMEALPSHFILDTRTEPSYEHMDFAWAINAHDKVYQWVLTMLNKQQAVSQA